MYSIYKYTENSQKHATVSVPFRVLSDQDEKNKLNEELENLRNKGVKITVNIIGNNSLSKGTLKACHNKKSNCNSCCPLKVPYCHCTSTSMTIDDHIFVCYGGHENCFGCDPCGSPGCHYPFCTVYHNGSCCVYPDGDSYDPFK